MILRTYSFTGFLSTHCVLDLPLGSEVIDSKGQPHPGVGSGVSGGGGGGADNSQTVLSSCLELRLVCR